MILTHDSLIARNNLIQWLTFQRSTQGLYFGQVWWWVLLSNAILSKDLTTYFTGPTSATLRRSPRLSTVTVMNSSEFSSSWRAAYKDCKGMSMISVHLLIAHLYYTMMAPGQGKSEGFPNVKACNKRMTSRPPREKVLDLREKFELIFRSTKT